MASHLTTQQPNAADKPQQAGPDNSATQRQTAAGTASPDVYRFKDFASI